MEININNKKFEKLNLIIFGIVFISFITVQDKSQFIMLGNCLYASFLIVIGIIIAKTIKLNPNGIDIFIGVIFTTTGILEVSFILNNLNTSSFQMNSIDGFFCWSIEILQLLGIYSSIYSNTKKLNVNNVFIKFIKILGVSLLGSIFITYILRKYIGILGLNITIENSITILTLVVCSRVRKKMKNTDKDNIERDLLSKITLLFVISRIIMLTLFMMKYIDSGYFFSRLIACMSIYYLYKYIVYTNIKKPYKELNHINKILEEKTMVLNNNNKRAMLEMKKTKILKDCLKVRDDKLKLTINSAMNPAVIFSYNKQIIYNNKSFYTQLSMNENYSVEEVLKLKFKTYKDILDNVDYVIENDEEIRRTIKSKDSKYYQVIFTPFIINPELSI